MKSYSLSIKKCSDAYICATQVNREKRQFKAGVYDQSGNLISEALRQDSDYLEQEHFTQIDKEKSTHLANKNVNKLSGHYIYLGFYTEHYGHFLLETLSRIWAVKGSTQYDGFIFSNFVLPRKSDELTSFASFCFKKLGLNPDKVIILKEDTLVETLTVPNAQCYILNKVHPNYINIFERLRQNVLNLQVSNLKFYLSRSKLQKRKRKVVNEHKIEEVFTEHGFKVVYMEDLTIDMQLSLLVNASVIAGLEGSALHNCLFMKPRTKVISICSVRQPNQIKPNQIMCNELNNIESICIPFSGHIINEGKLVTRFDIPHLRRCLRELNF
ncbi:glycosyltransferase 61 family protein [Pseudoalteromonas sp. C8]|uniref:glycosyltransferase family 61 protein n=1 Tax=Pseudoalteromonas sp. C8 TaxID=2686345 RepID=UPI0013FE26F5|nr:glycosyltransferase 61 family protein [Pseudoalteromonas sp. C8]